jgi:hypothetical protein
LAISPSGAAWNCNPATTGSGGSRAYGGRLTAARSSPSPTQRSGSRPRS